MKIAAMSKPMLATTMLAATASRQSGGAAARSRQAPLPTATLISSACLWPCLRSAHAESQGASRAEPSIAAAMIQAQTTPPGTPQARSAKTIFST